MLAKSAIKEALERLGEAVRTRAGDMGVEHLIEGDRDEPLVRAGLITAQPEQSAADASAEIANLRAEIASLRAKLADANGENERLRAEIERLKSALHEKVVEMIAAKLAANGETKPTVDDVVMAAFG
jgi:chromosome segregation ATPase